MIVDARDDFVTKPATEVIGIEVANGIYAPVASFCDIFIMNSKEVPVHIKKGATVARYELLPTGTASERDQQINAIREDDNSGAVIEVGDDPDKVNVRKLVSDYKDIFSFDGEIGSTNLCKHDIELMPNATPVAEPLRRHAQIEKTAVRDQIKDMLEKDIIEPSSSSWASAYVLVKKKNGKMRFCVDYRRVNSMTKKNVYPLPRLDDCLDFMSNKVYFTLLDFSSG